MSIIDKLAAIQRELRVPKNQFNAFGNFRYRSCEDIIESVKPIALAHNAVLVVSDEIVMLGNRYYVKATATMYDAETGESIYNSAYAREDEQKKGMDCAQLTGACSSYARKYCLGGLLSLDDNQDADSSSFNNNEETIHTPAQQQPQSTFLLDNDDVPYVCSECGSNVKPNVAKYSISRLKRCLCFSCQRKTV